MAKTEKLRFEIGDWVVHYFYGVGKVVDIVEKGLDDNRKTFFKVSAQEIEYWIPVEESNVEHIKPIRPPEAFEKALKIIAKPPEPMAKHHKSRKKNIQIRWKDGTLEARAELLRDMNGRLKLKKLNFKEKEMLEKVRHFYINEWITTDPSLTKKKARKKLRKALRVSVKKARRKEKKSD